MTGPSRSLPDFGRFLAAHLVEISASALRHVPAMVGVTAIDRGDCVEALVNYYTSSILSTRPVALAKWAQRYASALGPRGVIDVATAVADAVLRIADLHPHLDRVALYHLLDKIEAELFKHVASQLDKPATRRVSYMSSPPFTL